MLELNHQDPDPKLITLIAKQQVFLDNLVQLLSDYKSDSDIEYIILQLSDIRAAFDGIPLPLGTESANIPENQLSHIYHKIKWFRNELIR